MTTLQAKCLVATRTFDAHQAYILAAIAARCFGDERQQNALCWTWQNLVDNMSVDDAILKACHKHTFGGLVRVNQWDSDVSDHRSTQSLGDYDVAEDRRRETTNDSKPQWRLSDMPLRLRVFAIPLAHGFNKTTVAKQLGVSTKTVQRRVADIEQWVWRQRKGGAA